MKIQIIRVKSPDLKCAGNSEDAKAMLRRLAKMWEPVNMYADAIGRFVCNASAKFQLDDTPMCQKCAQKEIFAQVIMKEPDVLR